MAVRYYLYISDAKIDMLLPQIQPSALARIASDLRVDVKILSFGRTTERLPHDDRIARLDAVIHYIEDFADVGTPDEPGAYLQGILPMRWLDATSMDGDDAVYWSGTTEAGTVVGLGGSGHHVLGDARPEATPSYSNARRLRRYLMQLDFAVSDQEDRSPTGEQRVRTPPELAELMHAVERLSREPAENVEFLAKRLYQVDDDGRRAVLATPLYVALAD